MINLIKHFSETKLEIWEDAINLPKRSKGQGLRKIWKFMLDARKSHSQSIVRSPYLFLKILRMESLDGNLESRKVEKIMFSDVY